MKKLLLLALAAVALYSLTVSAAKPAVASAAKMHQQGIERALAQADAQ
jgi:hypothetical protein